MVSRKLVRRIRRRLWGGRVDIRVYDDGSSRIHVDHPSNDPEVELSMGAASVGVMRDAYADAGIKFTIGPITWRDDP